MFAKALVAKLKLKPKEGVMTKEKQVEFQPNKDIKITEGVTLKTKHTTIVGEPLPQDELQRRNSKLLPIEFN